MKKLLIAVLLFAILTVSTFAADKNAFGYYDYDGNGTVEFTDAITILSDMINGTADDASLLRVMHVMQGAVAGTKLAATVTSVDTANGTATVSTEYFENITIPLSMLGLGNNISAADYNGVPAVITVHAPASKFFASYNGDGKGIYLVQVNETFSGTPVNAVSKLYTIDELNKNATNGSHASDNYKSASLELNFRENVTLNSAVNGYTRYDNGWYPRVAKVNDNFYVMTYMYGQFGVHLYYVTSSDGINWNAPQVLWNQAHYPAFTYEDGPLAGTSDKLASVNPDICVLDDGTILCVYAVRPAKGYRYYPDLSGLFMKRGTPHSDGTITWSDEFKIYTGQVWEPSILKLSSGEIHVYFTQVAPDIVQYGYDENHRSTETGLIISKDNFATWTPNIQAGDTNYYRATTVYREYVGDKDGRPHYSGQMPVATELYNGKLFLAVEIRQLNGAFRVSTAVSNSVGAWKSLAIGEEGTYTKLTSTPISSPFVDRFPSGEVYLTYNYWHSGQDYLIGRLGKPDGSAFNNYFYNAGDSEGIWGSCRVVDSHKAITAMQDIVSTTTETADDGTQTTVNTYGINLYHHYLNHRINAKETSVILDGFINEWERNSDALFVGSETQAQATMQVAHDRDNVYFLVTRLDKCLTSKDAVKINVADGSTNYYTISINPKGAYTVTHSVNGDIASGTATAAKRFGTVDINTNVDQGVYIEFAIPKSQIGVSGTSFKVMPALTNKDASSTVTEDTLTGAVMTSTANWIEVVLD
ncbi:MAG: exo-alpha-sialidase [Clostridia bacterium]|nr:exo-alpha-sialidase [Clostridia bacterium]